MASYTVTITPEGTGGAQATVRVDVEHGTARVTEVVVRPGANANHFVDDLSTMDIELLLRAVQPAVSAIESVRSGTAPASPRQPAQQRPPTARNTRANASTRTPNVAADARAYRRMPDDLGEMFARIGSVTRLAAHYGVPRHTAQGWVNRLRKQAAP